jgi:hypothetical protein
VRTRLLGSIFAGLAGGALLLLTVAPTETSHYDYLVDDPRFLNQPEGLTLYGINKNWIQTGPPLIPNIPYRVCTDWSPMPAEASAAFANWEAVLPGTEFDMACESGPTLTMRRTSVYGLPTFEECGFPDRFVACTVFQFEHDSGRGGRYTSQVVMYIHDDTANGGVLFSSDGLGLRATVAHELGHVFGLHENYFDVPCPTPPPGSPTATPCPTPTPGPEGGCNSTSQATIMDAAVGTPSNPPIVLNGCDGFQPTIRDTTLVQNLYRHYMPQNISTAALVHDMWVGFRDKSWAEYSYFVTAFWLNPSNQTGSRRDLLSPDGDSRERAV